MRRRAKSVDIMTLLSDLCCSILVLQLVWVKFVGTQASDVKVCSFQSGMSLSVIEACTTFGYEKWLWSRRLVGARWLHLAGLNVISHEPINHIMDLDTHTRL